MTLAPDNRVPGLRLHESLTISLKLPFTMGPIGSPPLPIRTLISVSLPAPPWPPPRRGYFLLLPTPTALA